MKNLVYILVFCSFFFDLNLGLLFGQVQGGGGLNQGGRETSLNQESASGVNSVQTTIASSIERPQKLDSLMQRRMEYYKNTPILGYRILYFSQSGNNSSKITLEEKEKFEQLYPNIPSYLSYQAPNYKLKAGNFKTRLEANKTLRYIQREYPHAFIVKEPIEF